MEIQGIQADQNSPSKKLPSAAEIQVWMVAYIAEILEVDSSKIDINVPFDRYGLDSSVAIGLTNELEEWLEIQLDPTLLYDYPTIDALVKHLTQENNN
jgi:acyl carrier protein